MVIHSQVHLIIYNRVHNLSMKSETCISKSLWPLYLDVPQLVLGIIGVPEAPVRQDSNVVSFAFLFKIGGSLGDDQKKMILWSYAFKKDGLLNHSSQVGTLTLIEVLNNVKPFVSWMPGFSWSQSRGNKWYSKLVLLSIKCHSSVYLTLMYMSLL